MQEDDIDQLANWAEPILKSMEAKQRKVLMRSIATKVRKSNMERMKRQENPDGSAWEQRKSVKKGRRVHKSVEFLYKKGGGPAERRRLNNWYSTPKMMTGYDPDAGGIRSFRKDRVEQYIDINTTSSNKRLRSKKGGIKKKAMFTKLRTAKYLKTTVSPDAAGIEFRGDVGALARVHQFGLSARVGKGAGEYDYPQRRLLGLTRRDLEMISDEIMEHVSP